MKAEERKEDARRRSKRNTKSVRSGILVIQMIGRNTRKISTGGDMILTEFVVLSKVK